MADKLSSDDGSLFARAQQWYPLGSRVCQVLIFTNIQGILSTFNTPTDLFGTRLTTRWWNAPIILNGNPVMGLLRWSLYLMGHFKKNTVPRCPGCPSLLLLWGVLKLFLRFGFVYILSRLTSPAYLQYFALGICDIVHFWKLYKMKSFLFI